MDLFERSAFSELSPKVVDSFVTFHRDHPEIYRLFVKLTFELKTAGIRRYSVSAIFERMRWSEIVERGNRDFKLNNSYRSCLVRTALLEFPELNGFFETRKSKWAAA